MTAPTTTAPDYSTSLQLPVTDFPMRAGLPAREPGWVQRWLDEDVYGQLRAKRRAEGAETFILHLGPPYANGHMHMGHALTYVLKDFIVRAAFMDGKDSPYVPGWDCHGLPIEWKVEQDELRAKGKTKHDVSKAQLRAWCRAYATKWIEVQKAEWQRFGALGDWDRPYLTMDKANEAGIVRELGKMVERGLVYQGLKSTLWSWAEETALAEAEVEYEDKTSTAIYVALPLVGRDNEHLVIWTTTPWTLPANRAVAVSKGEKYVCLKLTNAGGSGDNDPMKMISRKFWVAKECLPAFLKVFESNRYEVSSERNGYELVGLTFEHPLYAGETGPVVAGDHVTTDSGTGLVHIAPSHGPEDFALGVAHGLDLRCPVDGAGKYETWAEEKLAGDSPLRGKLAGKLIWDAEADILSALGDTLLHASKLTHSYPVSWRSKQKLIYRSTAQWFIGLDDTKLPETGKSVRESALDCIYGRGVRGVQWVPEYGKNRIGNMIENRPDWCISRQRAWGVPITIFVDKKTDRIVSDPAVWEHIAALVEAEGIDAWDSRIEAGRVEELFPEGWLAEHDLRADDFTPVRDILDVWFDSGTTHAHVLRADSAEGQRFYRTDGRRPADMYLEGSDQHRGWFHSSMLTSIAAYGDAPYESVVTNGFVVDGQGRKFSKSLGNGVEPRQLMEKYGMDIIRLWVAASDYSEDIRYSPEIMDGMADAYRKFRNTFRWLLGNLNGFDAAKDGVDHAAMPELEQYILHRLHGLVSEVRGHFAAYQFHKAYRALYDFCTVDLSNFYFDVRKDALYCDAADSLRRRACQTALNHVFEVLATYLAPLMPFTTDEAWRSRHGEDSCVHLERFAAMKDGWKKDAAFDARWVQLMQVREQVNVAAEALRAGKQLGPNAEAAVVLPLAEYAGLSKADMVLVAEVTGASEVAPGEALAVMKHCGEKCPRCWRFYGQLASRGVCLRCDDALTTQKAA